MFKNKIITITGGTGSFGKKAINFFLNKTQIKELRVLSRDEMKQWYLNNRLKNNKVKFIIGDVREKSSLRRAIEGSDYVIHAAATKIVPTAEINPNECIKTNINGAMNVVDICIESNVKKVVALSTDKACNPVNLYGATKLCSDKLFVSANFLENNQSTKFSVVRYGNVMGSRGSVIPFFIKQAKNGFFTITDKQMTRFMINLNDAVKLVIHAFQDTVGGEIYISKIPSMKVIDIAKSINKKNKIKYIGIRPGEKLHEVMISKEDSFYTYEYKQHYKILPSILKKKEIKKYIKGGNSVKLGFEYNSETNKDWMKPTTLVKWINKYIKSDDFDNL